jgi:starvation-inducible outer membrane lipoprotein
MANARLCSNRFACALALVLSGTLALPLSLMGQATPATTQNRTAAEAQLPAAVQAQLDKRQDALKAARAAGDARAEGK